MMKEKMEKKLQFIQEEKVGIENKNKVFTEEEKAAYLNNLRNKYKDQKSIEQQFAEAKLVPEKDKENFVPALAIGGTVLIYRYSPVAIDLINKYGPVVYKFLSNPQNYQWAQVLIDNPELFAMMKDIATLEMVAIKGGFEYDELKEKIENFINA